MRVTISILVTHELEEAGVLEEIEGLLVASNATFEWSDDGEA
jgi:hypothetical protein